MAIHAAKVENSERLRRILALLRERREGGATGREIIHLCDVTGLEGVRELRSSGYDIRATYERVTAGGRFVWRYVLFESAQRTLFVVLFCPWWLLCVA